MRYTALDLFDLNVLSFSNLTFDSKLYAYVPPIDIKKEKLLEIYPSEYWKEKLESQGYDYKFVREVGGLLYYKSEEGDGVLVPETHPLFNYYVIEIKMDKENKMSSHYDSFKELVKAIKQKYIIPLLNDRN